MDILILASSTVLVSREEQFRVQFTMFNNPPVRLIIETPKSPDRGLINKDTQFLWFPSPTHRHRRNLVFLQFPPSIRTSPYRVAPLDQLETQSNPARIELLSCGLPAIAMWTLLDPFVLTTPPINPQLDFYYQTPLLSIYRIIQSKVAYCACNTQNIGLSTVGFRTLIAHTPSPYVLNNGCRLPEADTEN